MKKTALALLLCAAAAPLLAQEAKPAAAPAVAPADPALTGLKVAWNRVKDITVRAAKKMPEESYGFQATPEVKTFGQFGGHLADSTYMMAGPVLGETPPAPEAEKTKKTKAELVAALEDSFAYMDLACALGDAAAWPVQGLIRNFRDVIEARMEQYTYSSTSDGAVPSIAAE